MSDQLPRPVFNLFDPNAPCDTRVSRNLPHWFQPGAAMFVTFRTGDSLPEEVLVRWRRELQQWLLARKLPVELALAVTSRKPDDYSAFHAMLDGPAREEFQRLTGRLYHRSLDECHGACLLRRPQLSEVVVDNVLFGVGSTHDVECLVVMPNHVHVLAQFREGADPSLISQRWMRYSARRINRTIKRPGAFWQPEPFDHLVRSAESFERIRAYIRNNPVQARLKPDEYRLWNCGES
jgi:hypothetical protein